MKAGKLLLALTGVNFILLVALVVHGLDVARADSGERGADGTVQAETVLLRLITERGRPSVKIAASEPGSGLSFAGPTGTKNTYLILEARDRTSTLRLRNEDGKEQVVKP